MTTKIKPPKTLKRQQTDKLSEQIVQHPDIKLVRKIASISERAERTRTPLIPQQTKFYKL